MKLVNSKISIAELRDMAKSRFGNLVKAVVDVEKKVMAMSGELHADEEALLLQRGSKQENLWGINLYPDLEEEDFIEFDSVINLRPTQNNLSKSVEDSRVRKRINQIVKDLISR